MTIDFQSTLTFPVPANKLYEAVSTQEGVRKWWTKFAIVGNEVVVGKRNPYTAEAENNINMEEYYFHLYLRFA